MSNSLISLGVVKSFLFGSSLSFARFSESTIYNHFNPMPLGLLPTLSSQDLLVQNILVNNQAGLFIEAIGGAQTTLYPSPGDLISPSGHANTWSARSCTHMHPPFKNYI